MSLTLSIAECGAWCAFLDNIRDVWLLNVFYDLTERRGNYVSRKCEAFVHIITNLALSSQDNASYIQNIKKKTLGRGMRSLFMPCMVNAREHRETQGHQRPGTTKPTRHTALSSRYLDLNYNSRSKCHYVMPVLCFYCSGQACFVRLGRQM